jgi:hypothetical protein
MACILLLAAGATGCSTWGNKRDFSGQSSRPTDHFRVQFLVPEEIAQRPIAVGSLLLLEPVGMVDAKQSQTLMMAIWQELQQLLPGLVRSPRQGGPFAPYTSGANLTMDDGRLNEAELERIGRLAGASHLLIARVISYRPYHPQSLIMEWILLDVAQRRAVLVMAGALDATEQKVLMAAENYVRSRRSDPSASSGLDVMLRSPREFCRFGAALATDALKGWVEPGADVYVPNLSY